MNIATSPRGAESINSFETLAADPPNLRFTRERLAHVCDEKLEVVMGLAANGSLLVMAPTGSETGAQNFRSAMRLLVWAEQQGGWKVFASSTGFRLPNDS